MLKSLKSRVLLVLVVWLALSHLASLWLYARKHEEAASLLQDALVADKIATGPGMGLELDAGMIAKHRTA